MKNLEPEIKDINEEVYPSVELGYEIAMKSYEWAIQRMDAIDETIDKLLAWTSSVNLGVIAIIASRNLYDYFKSCYFYWAMTLFLLIILTGIATKIKGSLSLVSPEKLLSRLHKSPWQFKKDAIYLSAIDFRRNHIIVNCKGYASTGMIVCFTIEIIILVKWLTSLS